MHRETEVDDPLPVHRLGHLLQKLDSPQVVLDQRVICRQDRRKPILDGDRRKGDAHPALVAQVDVVSHGRAALGL
ncbi:hypothetical protein DF186_25550, partial [Enterococcus hirae]